MLGATIKVQVAGTVREYPNMVAEYGDWVANFGDVFTLQSAIQEERRKSREGGVLGTASKYWVILDGSGLVYLAEISRTGHYKIIGAALRSGTLIQGVYTA